MIRGTTAQFKFKLPHPKNEFEWIRIRFWQSNNPSSLLPITKNQDHCSVINNQNEIYVSLTAEETLRFSDKYKGIVQLRALHTLSGTIVGNPEWRFPIYPMSDEPGDEPIIPPADHDGWIILDGNPIITQ